MTETSDPIEAQAAALRLLEEENRVLREQLAAGASGGTDLRMLRLTDELRKENLRLAEEAESFGSKNIELVFQVEEAENRLQALQVALDEARSRAEQADATGKAERERLEGELRARLEETEQAGRTEAARLTAELEQAAQRASALEAALEEARQRAEAAGQEVQQELQEARQRGETLQQELQEARQRGEALQQELQEARQRGEALDEIRQRGEALGQELQEARQRGEALGQELEEARQRGEALGQQLEAARQRAGAVDQEILEARQRAEALDRELQEARAAEAAAREESGGLRRRAEELESGLEAARAEAETHGRRLGELEAALAETRGEAERQGTAAQAAAADVARLAGELDAARSRSSALEATLAQLEEQFLKQVEQEHLPRARVEQLEGPPNEVLSGLMESLLGGSGPVLVQRVYSRCAVAQDSRDPQALERVIDSLEETAGRLLSSPAQRTRMEEGLARLRTRWEAGAPEAAAPAATPEEAAAPTAAPAEAEAPAEVATPAATPVEATPEEREPAPAAAEVPGTAPVVEQPSAPPDARLGREGDGPQFREATDPDLLKQIEEGMKLLALEKSEESWDLFQALAQSHPDILEVQEGLFYNYVENFGWPEACQIGRRISSAALASSRRSRFATAMHTVLVERLKSVRDTGERKRLFLELAELHLDDRDQAMDFLARARQIPGRTPVDARIDFYMLRLLTGTSDPRLPHVLGALEGVADHVELFGELEKAAAENRNRTIRPAAHTLLTLIRKGRLQAGQAEQMAGGPAEVDPTVVDEAHDEDADLVLEFILNQLLPRAKVQIPFPSPAFQALKDECEPVPAGWKSAEILERFNRRLFRIPDLRLHLYRGSANFWLEATPEPTPELVLHPDLASLPPTEQQVMVLRKLFQLHHRHLQVWRAHEILDDEMRCLLLRLTRDIVQETGVDVADMLEREIDALKPGTPDLARITTELLDRLYYHCLREEFLLLKDFFSPGKPFADRLERASDRFAARLLGITSASYGIARESLGRGPLFDRLEAEGFQPLYEPPLEEHRPLRLRLQRLWLTLFE